MSNPNISTVHELKVDPLFFEAIRDGRKNFEIRKDDRPFKVGDRLYLREWHVSCGYTGRATARRVTYLTAYGQVGHVVMALGLLSEQP